MSDLTERIKTRIKYYNRGAITGRESIQELEDHLWSQEELAKVLAKANRDELISLLYIALTDLHWIERKAYNFYVDAVPHHARNRINEETWEAIQQRWAIQYGDDEEEWD